MEKLSKKQKYKLDRLSEKYKIHENLNSEIDDKLSLIENVITKQ